jgi:serine/threonine protein kinase
MHGAEMTDMFSLGATILTMLFLEFPFGDRKSCLESPHYLKYFSESSSQMTEDVEMADVEH